MGVVRGFVLPWDLDPTRRVGSSRYTPATPTGSAGVGAADREPVAREMAAIEVAVDDTPAGSAEGPARRRLPQ